MVGTSYIPMSTFASYPEEPIDSPSIKWSSQPINESVEYILFYPRPPPITKILKNMSEIWNHFTRVSDCDSNKLTTTCNHYGWAFKWQPKRQGTSALYSHIPLCSKNHKSRLDKSQKFLDSRMSRLDTFFFTRAC